MSDYYDSKGIRHVTQALAEDANEEYLREERRAREGLVEASKAQEKALQEMASLAALQRMDDRQHREEVERTQQAQLAIINAEAQAAAKARDYERDVIFLKESDDITKLERYLAMVKQGVASLYHPPRLPKECGADGALSLKIKKLAALPKKHCLSALPDEAHKLQSELTTIETELYALGAAQKGSTMGFLGTLGVVLALFGLCATLYDTYAATNGDRELPLTLAALGIGVGLVIIAIIRNQKKALKLRACQEQAASLEQRREKLTKELQVLLDQAWKEQGRDFSEAEAAHNRILTETLDQWQSSVARELLGSFFAQGLWIGDGRFAERLKAELTTIQKPFPTSCRTDVNNLGVDHIVAIYETFIDAVAREISVCSSLGKDDVDKLKRQEVSRVKALGILRHGPTTLANELPVPPLAPTEVVSTQSNAPTATYAVILVYVPNQCKKSTSFAVRQLDPSFGHSGAEAVVEGLPKTVLEGVTRAEADAAKHMLTEAGASVRLDMFTPL